jgi:hypothetical protein
MIRTLGGFSRCALSGAMRTLAVPRKGMAVLAAVAAVKNLEAQAAAQPHSDALKMAVDGSKPVMWVPPEASLTS